MARGVGVLGVAQIPGRFPGESCLGRVSLEWTSPCWGSLFVQQAFHAGFHRNYSCIIRSTSYFKKWGGVWKSPFTSWICYRWPRRVQWRTYVIAVRTGLESSVLSSLLERCFTPLGYNPCVYKKGMAVEPPAQASSLGTHEDPLKYALKSDFLWSGISVSDLPT